MGRMRRLAPSSSAFARSTAKRMKVPWKKPPAMPTVQLLPSAALDCSPAAAAVGGERDATWAISKGGGRGWAVDGAVCTSTADANKNDTPQRRPAFILGSPQELTTSPFVFGHGFTLARRNQNTVG